MRFSALQLVLCLMSCFVGACGAQSSQGTLFSRVSDEGHTVDVASSLVEILEYDSIQPACASYWEMLDELDNPRSGSNPKRLREVEVKCGKWLFLNWETSGKMPLPEILFDAIERSWPERVGKDFEKLGFLPNPSDPAKRPLGIARSTTRYTGMPSVNVTCAACHVGQLPDGRYAVGAPNTQLHLSEFNLMSYYPLYAAMHNNQREQLPTEIQSYYKELARTERRRVGGGDHGIDWSNMVFKYSKLLHWLGIGPKGLPDAKFVVMPPERDLKSWLAGRPGVFNPGAPMLTLQVQDVPNLSIPQLWGISGYESDYMAGRVAPLGQTTKYASLEKFVSSAFVYAFQDLSLVRPRHVRPLVAYLRQLKGPVSGEIQNPDLVQQGAHLFKQSCATCHDGAAGESTQLFAANAVGTHPSLANPRENYIATTPIAKLIDDLSRELAAELQPQPIGIRSRRLRGIWARSNLMIDGSVADLSDLFCLKEKRLRTASPHQDLCDTFAISERESLLAYLKTL
ncbi:hypothetical protein EBU99_09065 [bacterium]|nr:hypothetical protein [bacterium]